MTYKLKSLDIGLHGWPANAMFLRDGTSHRSSKKTELDAQVAANDYFAILATRLDQVSQSLKDSHLSDYAILEETICDLLYMQQHYKIAKKTSLC